MQIINDQGSISRGQSPGMRQILSLRISQLELSEGETLADIGAFYVVDEGDNTNTVETNTGCYIVSDPFGETHYGDDGFEPTFEWLEHAGVTRNHLS